MMPPVPPWATFAVLAAAGFVAALVNTLAGGGSFLTLPLLIFLGLPAAEANGTNRLGVVAQNVAAVRGFHREGVLPWRYAWRVSLVPTAASVLGAWLALHVGDREFRRLLAGLMVAITLWTVLEPLLARRAAAEPGPREPRPVLAFCVFLAAGLYGGFVQAGVGFLVLAATTFAGLDLVRGNAVKVFLILLVTVVALGVFAWDGKVRWGEGLALGAGSVAGSLVGVRLAVEKGDRWLRGVVALAAVIFATRLWYP
jgi:uncharacterized membrane protein YfcA